MKLGISSYSYGWAVGVAGHRPARPMDAFDLLDRAQAYGVHVVQYGDNLPLDRLTVAERAALRREAEQAGVQVEVGARGIDPAHLQGYLALAAHFGSNILRTVIDTATHHPGEDEVVQTLRPVMAAFAREGVCLAIENHDRFPARLLRRLMERIDSPAVGICLDTANSLGAQEGVRLVAETLVPWIVSLHVKDISVRRLPHLMGFVVEGRPAGEGDLDLPWLLEYIRMEVPQRVNAILELWPPPEDSLEKTIEKEAAWVEASLRYLRQLIPD
jgi:sugar phosphate isomerase/epimerase